MMIDSTIVIVTVTAVKAIFIDVATAAATAI